MIEKFKELGESLFVEEFHVEVVEEIDDVELRFSGDVLSEKEALSFFQKDERGLQILVKLIF
jgi:hypothetical protein